MFLDGPRAQSNSLIKQPLVDSGPLDAGLPHSISPHFIRDFPVEVFEYLVEDLELPVALSVGRRRAILGCCISGGFWALETRRILQSRVVHHDLIVASWCNVVLAFFFRQALGNLKTFQSRFSYLVNFPLCDVFTLLLGKRNAWNWFGGFRFYLVIFKVDLASGEPSTSIINELLRRKRL